MIKYKKCRHRKRIYDCKICYPESVCKHNIRRSSCTICWPKCVCEHNLRRSNCRVCSSHRICPHNKWKFNCALCSVRTVYNSYKRNARVRDMLFELSLEEFTKLVESPCFYRRGTSPAQGVDQYIHGAGYTILNSVPCCAMCNEMKMDNSPEEFLIHVRKIFLGNEICDVNGNRSREISVSLPGARFIQNFAQQLENVIARNKS